MCSKSAWLITLLQLCPTSYTHIISSSSSTSRLPLAQRDGPCSLYLQYTKSLLQSKCSFHTFVLWSFRIFSGMLAHLCHTCPASVTLHIPFTLPPSLQIMWQMDTIVKLFLQLGCSCLHRIGSQVFQLHCAV